MKANRLAPFPKKKGKIPLDKGIEKELPSENIIGRERYH